MCGEKHQVGAMRGRMLGEYPRDNKCLSMSVFPAKMASWHGEDAENAECGKSSGSCGGVGSMVHQDWSGPAARTWSNSATSPTLAAVSSAVRAGRDLKPTVGSADSDQNLENFLRRMVISLAVRGANCMILSPTAAMNLVRGTKLYELYSGFRPRMKRAEYSSRSLSRMPFGSAPAASTVATFWGKQALIAATRGELYIQWMAPLT